MAREHGGARDELTGRLAACASVLVLLVAIGAWQRHSAAGVEWSAPAIHNSFAITYTVEQVSASCNSIMTRQLEELLTLKQRHRLEMLGAEIGGQALVDSQLFMARQALEEAQLNYEHAKQNSLLACSAATGRA